MGGDGGQGGGAKQGGFLVEDGVAAANRGKWEFSPAGSRKKGGAMGPSLLWIGFGLRLSAPGASFLLRRDVAHLSDRGQRFQGRR